KQVKPKLPVYEVCLNGTDPFICTEDQKFNGLSVHSLEIEGEISLGRSTEQTSHIEYVNLDRIVKIDEDVALLIGLCMSKVCWLVEKDVVFGNCDPVYPFLFAHGHKLFNIKPDLKRDMVCFRSDAGFDLVKKLKNFDYKPIYGMSYDLTQALLVGYFTGQSTKTSEDFIRVKHSKKIVRGVYNLTRCLGVPSLIGGNMAENLHGQLTVHSVKPSNSDQVFSVETNSGSYMVQGVIVN